MLARVGIFMFWLIHFLPFRVIVALGNGLGILLYPFASERRRVGMINLSLCFPELDESQRKRLVHAHFKMFCRSLMERSILWWSSAKRINALVRVEGREHFEAIRGKPAVLLAPHFVAMDTGGQWAAMHTDGVSMYSNQKNPYLTKVLRQKRARFGHQQLYSRQEGLRPILKSMRKGKMFLYLPDQDQGIRDGAFVPFFGVPAATMTSLSRIAQIAGARVVPAVTRVLPGSAGYVLTFYPAWENFPSGDDIADARRMNAFIEDRVREMPEQYFWLHKRFKTRPSGAERFY